MITNRQAIKGLLMGYAVNDKIMNISDSEQEILCAYNCNKAIPVVIRALLDDIRESEEQA